jgi:hypothetical protein
MASARRSSIVESMARAASAVDQPARMQQLERTRTGIGVEQRLQERQRIAHVDAGATADLNQALDLERDERLADGSARYRQAVRKIALRRQA